MGARSDWQSAPPSENGDHTEHEHDGEQTEGSRRAWTIFNEEQDESARKNRETADEHVHNYVQDQLKRLMSPDEVADRYKDELETEE